VLYRLEAEGLIRSEYKERRKYYALTATGKETLALAKEYFGLLAEKI
jgi:DNA-binding PadR family transcriptional regulator